MYVYVHSRTRSVDLDVNDTGALSLSTRSTSLNNKEVPY